MMRKIILLLLGVFIGLNLKSQVDVVWGGQQIAQPRLSYIGGLIGSSDSKVFALKIRPRSLGNHQRYFLETYARKTLGLISSVEIHLPEMNGTSSWADRFFYHAGKFKTANLERIFFLNGKLILFTSFYDKSKGKNYAFVQYLNEDGSLDKNRVEIDVIEAPSKRNKGNFDFVLSEDQTRILIFHNEPFEKYDNEKFSYKVIDSGLNTLWSKKLELPYRDQQFHIAKYRVDNDGNVFMLASIDKNKDQVERRKPAYTYSMLAYFYQQDKLKEYTVDLGDKYISDITFNFNPAGDLVCAGFFSKNSQDNQAGTFFLKIDKVTAQVSERSINEFDKNFLLEFMSERKVEKGNELFNFDIGHLLLREDGSAIMVAEQYYVDVVSWYNPATRTSNYSYHYYYNDIIVVGFSPKGDISLLKRISKYQHSINDGGPFASYVLVDGGTMLHFIYNDNPDNLHRSESEIGHGHGSVMNNPSYSVAVMVSMDMNGNIQRNQLLDNHSKKNSSWFLPKMYMQLNPHEVILFAKRGKYYRFGRISV